MVEGLIVVVIVVALVALALLAPTCFVITKQQHVRFVETFGRYAGTRRAGLSLKLPYPLQIASPNFSLKILEVAQDVSVKSSDNAFVIVPIRVQYAATEGRASDAYYRLEDPERQLTSYIVNQVRATAASMDFAELFSSKDRFEEDVASTLADQLGEYGYTIENVLVDDPQPSKELRQAFDKVLASRRLLEAAQNEGEAVKIKAILDAEASKEAMILKAEGYAGFREIIAKGNAAALQDFVGETGVPATAVLDFFAHTNAMEALRDAADAGGKTVLVTGDKPAASHGLFAEPYVKPEKR